MPKYDRKDIDPINQRNLKKLENGGTIDYWQKAQVVAIGPGHKNDLMADLQEGGVHGKVTITKGKLLNAGSLQVTGCRNQSEFKDSIKRISKKAVFFK